MKNVLLLSANMLKGGAERVISILIQDFESDPNINLIFVQMEEGIEYTLPKTVKPIILSKSRKSKPRKALELLFVAFQIFRIIKDKEVDVVLSFLYRPNYINILSKLMGAKHKSIINIRSTTSRYLATGLLGKVNLFLVKRLFNSSDLIISNSKGVEKDLKDLMEIKTKTQVINNPIDLLNIEEKKYVLEDIEFSFYENKKYVISAGRLISLKRNEDLIKAFFELYKDDLSLELIFLGEGNLKRALKQICISLGIEERVHFLGNVSNPYYYFYQSDLFVLNSEIEGFPNVLIEAMACGLPVISSNYKSGPYEILGKEKYGLIYPVGDINALVSKMKYYLYENINIQSIRKANKQRIMEFNKPKILKLYKNALQD